MHPCSGVEGQLMLSREELDDVKLAGGAWRSVGQFWMKVSAQCVNQWLHCSCMQHCPCTGSTATKARQIPCSCLAYRTPGGCSPCLPAARIACPPQ